jgi:hypothetical protein
MDDGIGCAHGMAYTPFANCHRNGFVSGGQINPAHWRIKMSQPNSDPVPASANRNSMIFIVVAALLIGSFLYRVLVPAHEYAVRPDQLLTMAIDLALIVSLVGLKQRAQLPGGTILFWIALIAGVGLFAIRLLGDDQWWTGHLVYYIEPRRF